MHNFISDLKFAIRNLSKSPGFVVVAIITLALGIGLNSAIFSVINMVLFRPLPYDIDGAVVSLYRPDPETGRARRFSYPHFEDYRDQADLFEHMVAWTNTTLSVGRGDGAEMRIGEMVSGDYFQALGTKPLLGRFFTREDDTTPRAHPVTVISASYWQRRLNGDPDIVGETIALNGSEFTIIGVAPPGFTGVQPLIQPVLWVTMMMEPVIDPTGAVLDQRGSTWMDVFGVLKPDATIDEGNAQLDLIAAQLRTTGDSLNEHEQAKAFLMRGAMTDPDDRPMMYQMTVLVMTMVGLVLMIACANIANLLLARSTSRRKEIGIRLALGSSRLRLVRQLLIESMLLALVGGGVGLLVGVWAINGVKYALPQLPMNIDIVMSFGLDMNMVMFALGISLLTGLVFGLVPAIGAARADLLPALKDDGAGGTHMKRSRMRSSLVIAQVAVSMVLLIASGLFVRSLVAARSIDPGFEHENTLSMMLELDRHQYDAENATAFCQNLLARVRELPGVESACLERCVPLSFNNMTMGYHIEGDSAVNDDGTPFFRSVRTSVISTDDFKTLGIPILMGRDFTEQEMYEDGQTVIINQVMAEEHWPGKNPLGKRLSFDGAEGPFVEVVGVVKTVIYDSLGEAPTPVAYRALPQMFSSNIMLLTRTSGDPLDIMPAVRSVIRELDPNFSPSDTRSLTDVISFALLPAKAGAAMFSLFGIIALILATVGLYGVMSYVVGQRTREIGIRMAVGAAKGDVLRLIMRQGLVLTGIGLAIGLVCAVGFSRVLAAMLYDISPWDPITFASISALLATVAAVATLVPARRAMRVDPMVALRYE